MGNKQKKCSGGSKKKKKQANTTIAGDSGMIMIDPARCRFQHSKIRPYFSGCGRSVHTTLQDIRDGTTKISDLPPIQVLISHETSTDNEPWYFSLNNRRLWVLKRLREEGHLEKYGNKVAVRVRKPKSQQEKERYTLANCAVEAKIVPEKKKKQQQQQRPNSSNQMVSSKPSSAAINGNDINNDDDDGDAGGNDIDDKAGSDNNNDDSDSDSGSDKSNGNDSRAVLTTRNRFANMMMDDSSSDDDDDD